MAPAVGAYAALALGLFASEAWVNKALAALARVSPLPAARTDIVAWPSQPLPQARSYVVVLALCLGASLAHGLVVRALRARPSALLAAEGVVVAGAAYVAFTSSELVKYAFLIGILPASVLLIPFVSSGPRAKESGREAAAIAVGVAMQSIAVAWGVWITTFTRGTGIVVAGQLAAWTFSAWRATRRARSEEEAVAGLPFTLLPVVGLLREPGLVWIVVALGAYLAVLGALRGAPPLARRLRGARTAVADVVVAASFWAAMAILTTPYRLRDLPRLNHNSHETGAYATVNSILHGKFMMADAGLIYGPLRSYALTLYTLIAGVTAEQVRIGQAVFNLLALAALMYAGWRLLDRRFTAMLAYVVLLLVDSLVTLWPNYAGRLMSAFGWADIGRIALPFLAVVGCAAALVRATRSDDIDRPSLRRMAAWGAFGALSTLWAQEFGVCAVVAMGALPVVHCALTRGVSTKTARLGGLCLGASLAGTFATWAVYLAIYALFGKARLFLSTVTAQSAAFTSGSYGVFPFPVNERSFGSWSSLFAEAPHAGRNYEYILPVAVYLLAVAALSARALTSSWRERDTMTLAITLFGLLSFRFALGRSDITHVWTVTLPATVLAPRLLVEGMQAIHESPLANTAFRALATGGALALALYALNLTGFSMALEPRISAILTGYERPSSGPAYSYPDLPRIGDVKMDPDYVALAQAIVQKTSPTDKIFQHIGYMDGGEIYFVTNRVNPTRYDILAEFLTTDRQKIALDELTSDPPVLEFGQDWGMVGEEIHKFVKERYQDIGKVGPWEMGELRR
jgi:hypothetical protein